MTQNTKPAPIPPYIDSLAWLDRPNGMHMGDSSVNYDIRRMRRQGDYATRTTARTGDVRLGLVLIAASWIVVGALAWGVLRLLGIA